MKQWHKSLEENFKIITGNKNKQNNFKQFQNTTPEIKTGCEEFTLTENVHWINLNKEAKIEMEGRLIGGCIDNLVNIIGTKYDKTNDFIRKYSYDGVIWYFDNCELSCGSLARILWQFKENGWFKHTNGIIFGRMPYKKNEASSFQEGIKAILNELDIPIIIDADIGHIPPNLTIINGAYAKITTEKGNGTIEYTFR